MRKALAAFACIAGILLVAGTFAFSHGRVDATIEALADTTTTEPSTDTTNAPELAAHEAGFEVMVLVNGQPLEEYYSRGRHYVEALEGAEYELRIRNPLPERVAVALSVDGLNSIDARRTTAWNSSKWVIEPYGTIYIKGWQMSAERARHFYFTTERDSYGTKLGQTANLGVISAVFFRERNYVPVPVTPGPPRPRKDDEPMERKRAEQAPKSSAQDSSGSSMGGASRSNNTEAYPAPDDEYAATGIGRNVHHDVTWINLNLEPHPIAQVMIRYEYHDALVRLGILPHPYPGPDPLRRRERSTGFEDHRYSPEP